MAQNNEELDNARQVADTARNDEQIVRMLANDGSETARQLIGHEATHRFLRYIALGFREQAAISGDATMAEIANGISEKADSLPSARQGYERIVDEPAWEAWTDQATSLKHVGEKVNIKQVDSGESVLSGTVVSYSDLLGSGGVLQPHPERGMDQVTAAIRFPQDPQEFEREMAQFVFQVVE